MPQEEIAVSKFGDQYLEYRKHQRKMAELRAKQNYIQEVSKFKERVQIARSMMHPSTTLGSKNQISKSRARDIRIKRSK